MPYPNIKKMDDSIHLESKPLCLTNIWIDDINNEINDPHPTIFVTNTINIEHYDLQSDFVIQSCNGSKLKSQFLEDGNVTKSSYSMIMEIFEYCSLLRQVNEEQKSIFDDIMHRNQLYPDTSICLFFYKGCWHWKNFYNETHNSMIIMTI